MVVDDETPPPTNEVFEIVPAQFVLAMMLELGVCEWAQVRPFLKKFRALDADGSGKLSRDDLVMLVGKQGGARPIVWVALCRRRQN